MASIATLICTMNRPDELRRAIDSLTQCRPPPAEIIVSDDSPADDRRTQAICKCFSGIRYQSGPRRGLAANRNACLKLASADHVHFIDDDVVVPPDFYAAARRLLAGSRDSRVVLTGFELRHDPVGGLITKVEAPRAGFWAHLVRKGNARANCVVINAAIFPRELFQRTAFDEYFRYGYEESDLTLQAIAAGYSLVCVSDLFVDHFPSPVNRDRYDPWIVASQTYAGLKRHWVYRRSAALTGAFLLLSVPRLLLAMLRRNGLKASLGAASQARRAVCDFACSYVFRKPREGNSDVARRRAADSAACQSDVGRQAAHDSPTFG